MCYISSNLQQLGETIIEALDHEGGPTMANRVGNPHHRPSYRTSFANFVGYKPEVISEQKVGVRSKNYIGGTL
jgi:hypothetical protein